LQKSKKNILKNRQKKTEKSLKKMEEKKRQVDRLVLSNLPFFCLHDLSPFGYID